MAWVRLVLPTEPVTAPRPAPAALRSRARGDAQAFQRDLRVVDDDRRAVGRPRDKHAGRALGLRLGDELVAVALAGQGDEDVAGLERAGVDGDAGGDEGRAAAAPASRLGDLVGGPERLSHAPPPARARPRPRSHRRRAGGSHQPACPVRGPCRRPRGCRQGRARPRRRRSLRAGRRSRGRRARRPGWRRGWRRLVPYARIVVRDDDEVGQPRGDLAHQRPLAPVTIAAGAEDDDQSPPAACGRRAASTVSRPSGVWA